MACIAASPPRAAADAPLQPLGRAAGPGLHLAGASASRTLSTACSRTIRVVFDGWLHDRAALCPQLGLPPEASDAQLVLRAYRTWGAALPARLAGAFALCVWDGRRGTALVARDPLGVFSLFYAYAEGAWFLATSPEVLRRHPAVPGAISRGALAAHLLNWNRDIHETVYRHIRRLPPGHQLIVAPADGRAAPARYWSPLPDGAPAWVGEEELEHLPRLLSQAADRYLQRGTPALYLSGGLDSGTVATFTAERARAQGRPPPHAYSLVFDDPEDDEGRVQRGLAEALGIPQTLVPIDLGSHPLDAFHASLELNRDWPHPLASTFRSVYLDLGARARADGHDLVLTGDGGDEWLAVHPRLAADYLAALDLPNLRRLLATRTATHGYSPLEAARQVLWADGLRVLLLGALAGPLNRWLPGPMAERRRTLALAALPPWLAPDPDLRRELLARSERANGRAWRSNYERDVVGETLEHPLTVLYMDESFESSRRIGIPILKPFYDPDVVRFLARVPPHLRARGGRSKGLLRGILHARFPQLGYDTQRKPYATNFFATMVQHGVRASWSESGGVRVLEDLGIVDSAIMAEHVFSEHGAGCVTNPKSLWTILCAERWVRAR